MPTDASFPTCEADPPKPDGTPPSPKEFGENDTLIQIRSETPGKNETLLSKGRGSRGEAVRLVQQAILSWSCRERQRNLLPVFGADGHFGRETEAAVRKFQCEADVTVDGIVGPITVGRLDALIDAAPPFVIPPGSLPAPPPIAPVNTLRIWINAFIPADVPIAHPVPGRSGATMIPGPIDCFATDQRTFDATRRPIPSSRMHSEMSTDFARGTFSEMHTIGATHRLNCRDGALECRERAPTDRMRFARTTGRTFSVTAAASNPCFPVSPDIDYRGTFSLDRGTRELVFKVLIDRFPAFEAYAQADGGPVSELFRMGPIGESPFELFGGATASVEGKKRL